MVATPMVTMVSTYTAKKGFKFYFNGPAHPCKDCNLSSACTGNITPGRVYTVISVRDVTHPCPVHAGGVRVVEVELAELEVALESSKAFEGVYTEWKPARCDLKCPFRKLCNPLGLKEGDKIEIVGVGEEVKCLKGLKLVKCYVKPRTPQ